jgi:hypothetical protein
VKASVLQRTVGFPEPSNTFRIAFLPHRGLTRFAPEAVLSLHVTLLVRAGTLVRGCLCVVCAVVGIEPVSAPSDALAGLKSDFTPLKGHWHQLICAVVTFIR